MRIGLKVSVFIQVTLERQVEPALGTFEKAIRGRPEVMECYLMTGDADYLLRVVVPDIQVLEDFILNFLTRVPGVGNIKSSFALKQVKYQTELPRPSRRQAPVRYPIGKCGSEEPLTRPPKRGRTIAYCWRLICFGPPDWPRRLRTLADSRAAPAGIFLAA